MSFQEPQGQFGDRSRLTLEQDRILHEQVLPAARRWLSIPTLADHAKQTLAYWGESA